MAAARRAADQFMELAMTRLHEEEQALSDGHSKVNATLERARRITANAEQFDRAKQLLQRSSAEANAKTFPAFQEAHKLTMEAQSCADAALRAAEAFNAEEYRRKEKRRRFAEASEHIPRLFLGLPLILGIVGFLVLGFGSCVAHIPI